MYKITVFTPTYNRAYTLCRLYESLRRQSFLDFEWMVIDDGSSDDTEGLMKKIVDECKFSIRYIKQENGGKHRAINRGVKGSLGELFFIVDSDDYLSENALTRIWTHYENVKNDADFCGVSGIRAFEDGVKIGGEETWEIIDSNSIEIRSRFRVKGDLAEVWKTDVLAKFPFPEFEGETFCGEALVWRRIARAGYKIRFFYEKIYICEYLPDGLTQNLNSSWRRGRRAAVLSTFEAFQDISWSDIVGKIRAGGAWWEAVFRAWILEKDVFIGIWGALVAFPVGLAMLVYHTIKTSRKKML